MFTSDLLGTNDTTRIAVVSGASTTNFTPATPVMVTLTGTNNSAAVTTIQVAGVVVWNVANPENFQFEYYAGAGQAQAITLVASVGMIISTRKVN